VASSLSPDNRALLAGFDLGGKSAPEIIDELDRTAIDERASDLMASVRPDRLVIAADGQEFGLEIPADRFYLSVAPYVDGTHECFYHSLTTCQGELSDTDVQVQIVDRTHDEVLVDETRTTYDNGFVGFWLPRGIEGVLRVEYDGKVAETEITTNKDAPTCLTTLKLV
jgi:hypothetical protein